MVDSSLSSKIVICDLYFVWSQS